VRRVYETIVIILATQSTYRKIKFVAPRVMNTNIIVTGMCRKRKCYTYNLSDDCQPRHNWNMI